jgi:hypothetical protein
MEARPAVALVILALARFASFAEIHEVLDTAARAARDDVEVARNALYSAAVIEFEAASLAGEPFSSAGIVRWLR